MNLRTLLVLLLTGLTALLGAATATASVTAVTSPEEETYEGSIAAESEGGHVVLHNPTAAIECNSKLESAVEVNGEEAKAGGTVASLSFTGCTSGWDVTTVAGGSLWVEQIGSGNGTVTSNGMTISAFSTALGITCRYKTSETDLGILTGSAGSEANATLDLSASIPFHSGSIFCGTGAAAMTGSYVVTGPVPLAAVPVLQFKSTASPVTFSGSLAPTQKSEWVIEKVAGGTSTCTAATFESVATLTPAKTIDLTPKFVTCTSFGYAVDISSANGCTIVLKQPTIAKKGNAAIRCPSGKYIALIGEEKGVGSCEVRIGEVNNGNLKAVTYENTVLEPTKIEAKLSLTEITGEVAAKTGTCSLTLGDKKAIAYNAQVTLEDKLKKNAVSVG